MGTEVSLNAKPRNKSSDIHLTTAANRYLYSVQQIYVLDLKCSESVSLTVCSPFHAEHSGNAFERGTHPYLGLTLGSLMYQARVSAQRCCSTIRHHLRHCL